MPQHLNRELCHSVDDLISETTGGLGFGTLPRLRTTGAVWVPQTVAHRNRAKQPHRLAVVVELFHLAVAVAVVVVLAVS